MKKIFLLCIFLSTACFAQLQIVEEKPQARLGFFFGVGLGAGANMMKFVGNGLPYSQERAYASLLISAKLGGFYYFTKIVGLRYYYNLDLNFNPGEAEFQAGSPIHPFYILSGSHTLNADAIVNVFASKDFKVDVLAGMGLGLIAGKYGPRYKTVYDYALSPYRNNFVDFEFRFNVGTRVMFSEKYGIELMAKLPVTPATQVYGNDANNYQKSSPYYFSLDFVMERF